METTEKIKKYITLKHKFKRISAESYATEHEYNTATGTYERNYEN